MLYFTAGYLQVAIKYTCLVFFFSADDTLKSVHLKTSTMVPPNSNVRKKLLSKTSLIKKTPLSSNKQKLKNSIPFHPKVSRPTTTRRKKSKLQPKGALDLMSKEEEEMAMNLSQEASNVSKILGDDNLW